MLLRVTFSLPDWLAILIECVLVGVGLLLAYTVLAIIMIFMERKVCAAFQCRLGPMRVGPWGTLQVLCDVLKMLVKEIFWVDKADKVLYCIAPLLVIVGSVGAFGFLPWNNGALALDFNCSIFLYTAVSSIGVLGVFLAKFVITTAEVDFVMFGRNIYLGSYLLAAALTVGFSVMVTLFMHKRLKTVDMIEALKSVE